MIDLECSGGGDDFYLIPALAVTGPQACRLVQVLGFAGRVEAELASVHRDL